MHVRVFRPVTRGGQIVSLIAGMAILAQLFPGQAVASVSAAPSGVISGTITVDGSPISDGSVQVFAMPNQAANAADTSHTPLKLTQVATASTDSQGRFAATPPAIPQQAVDPDGTALFMATISDDTSSLNWFFQLDVSALPSPATTLPTGIAVASPARSSIRLRIDLGKNPGVDDLDNPAALWQSEAGYQQQMDPQSQARFQTQPTNGLTPSGMLKAPTVPIALTGAGLAVPNDPGDPCLPMESPTGVYQLRVNEAFANVWSWPGALVTFDEEMTSSHTLGLAYQDTLGAWSQNASVSFTESAGDKATRKNLWDNQLVNQVNYQQYMLTNSCYPASSSYLWKPESTAYLINQVNGYLHGSHPNWSANGCQEQDAGTDYTKSSSKNTTFAGGVGFTPIALSAQAGWDSGINEYFDFQQDSLFCGSTNMGVAGSAEAEAHALVANTTYHAMPIPGRVLDTRKHIGLTGTFLSQTKRTFAVAGQVGVPWNAVAITANVTVANQTAGGFVTVAPALNSGQQPATSTVNFLTLDSQSNNVTVSLLNGNLDAIYWASNGSCAADIIVDVTGYFTADTSGATFHTLTPSRVMSTRDGTGLSQPFYSQTKRSFKVAGVGTVPSNATAVTGNLTALNESAGGFVTVAPSVGTGVIPAVSTLNFRAGDVRSNGITVALSGGQLDAMYWTGNVLDHTDLIFDVTGYFTNDLTGATYHPIDPVRAVDSRIGFGVGNLQSQFAQQWQDVVADGVPGDAVAVTGNATVANQTAQGYLTIAPSLASGHQTATSTVNFPVGDVRSNSLTVGLSGGSLATIYWAANTSYHADLIFDVTGYYGPNVRTQ
jgi:hypothetical protein